MIKIKVVQNKIVLYDFFSAFTKKILKLKRVRIV